MIPAERQFEILSRQVEEIIPESGLLERLKSSLHDGRPMRVKQGFDPTAPDIHLGHTVGLRKLRAFQDLGHQVVLIVGDYTGMVGDPSGRSKTRPQLTREEVERNAETYLDQFFRVLDPHPASPRLPVEVHRNGEWFARMAFADVLRLVSQYTVSQMLERDDFSKRFEGEQPIGVHELLYPLMQGRDSVEIQADVEIGATEQKFNLLVGRELQRLAGQPPQIVMTLPVLPGLDGVQRMSKSLGNYIGVGDSPSEMFGKVMSIPDALLPAYWSLVADRSDEEAREIERDLGLPAGELDRPGAGWTGEAGAGAGRASPLEPRVNPMLVKKRLGERIVAMYHGGDAATRARADFEAQFSRREVPEHLDVFTLQVRRAIAKGELQPFTIIDLAVASGIPSSRSAARRLVEQGAVDLDGKPVRALDLKVDPDQEHLIRIGRKMMRYLPGAGTPT
jgi:tyrosyl-tRNA synthetase